MALANDGFRKRAASAVLGMLFIGFILLAWPPTISYLGLESVLSPGSSPVNPRPDSRDKPDSDNAVGTYNVRDYGAKGDGRTIDRAAIQTAVDKAGAAGGGKVYFPKGIYLVDDSVVVRNDNVILQGAGWESDVRITVHPHRVIVISGSSHNAVRDMQISLGVSGAARDDADEGIYVTSKASDFIIENVFGNKKGIMVRGNVNGGQIRNNTVKDTLADGIHITGGSRNIKVLDNRLSGTGDDAIAVVSYLSQPTVAGNVEIRGNAIRDSYSRGIANVGGEQVQIIGNTIEGTSSSGILVDEDLHYDTFAPRGTRIEMNVVERAGLFGTKRGNVFGIEVAPGAGETSIVGNRVAGGADRGISIASGGTIVRGNVIADNRSTGLHLDGDDCEIVDNVVENNGGYGFYSDSSDRLKAVGNSFVNNNASGLPNVDNFLLKDSRGSLVTDNESYETRQAMQVERTYELVDSCNGLVFERNESKGSKLGTYLPCAQ
ncbi:right-handed parallel beta-helix repeat-containing protein [Cohnella sp. GCM10027633]|uniref:right-handed parallel beta-helix repeat-containing protein n=1 Tax=unclassified Cohnella TaxID=2636738 RepID=UPI00363AF0F2